MKTEVNKKTDSECNPGLHWRGYLESTTKGISEIIIHHQTGFSRGE
jgi:hypothetical protein